MINKTAFSVSLFFLSVIFVFFPALLSAGAGTVPDGDKLSAASFLSIMRNPPGRHSWANMEGTAVHRRSGAKTIKAPLRLGLLFTPVQTIAQLDFNNGEIYNIGQTLGKNAKTVLTKKFPDTLKAQLPLYGIEPQDLAMSFLYWDLLREEESERLKGQLCRKFILKEQDKNGKYLRVSASARYFFPVKAEFFHTDPSQKDATAYKTLEITHFLRVPPIWIR